MGKNELGCILKTNCTRVGMAVPPGKLGKWGGGHGLRRFALEGIGQASLGDTACMQFSGHRTVEGLKSYKDGNRATRKILTAAAFNGNSTAPRPRLSEFDLLSAAALPVSEFLVADLPPTLLQKDIPVADIPATRLHKDIPVGDLPAAPLKAAPIQAVPFPAPPATPMDPWSPVFTFPITTPTSQVNAGSLKGALKELKEAFDEGLLNELEYQSAKSDVLRRLR
jgi:hypothetical protein